MYEYETWSEKYTGLVSGIIARKYCRRLNRFGVMALNIHGNLFLQQ